MLSNSQIQAAWIAKLKANANVTALVPAVEIREDLYKGTIFSYPNIRVKLGNLTPQVPSSNCQVFQSEVSILVFTEQKSSKQTDDIAGVFWGKTFSSNGVRFAAVTLTALVPATVPEFGGVFLHDENSWMAQVQFTATVQSA
jgi:hypothetical protein